MTFSAFLRRPTRIPQKPRRPRRRTTQLSLEALEVRCLLSPYVVTSTNDSGSGSLRDAITQVNKGLYDSINFDFPGPAEVKPLSALPAIVAKDVFIEGGYNKEPFSGLFHDHIVIDGSLAGNNSNGLVLQGVNDKIEGLVIGNFALAGLEVLGGAATPSGDTNDIVTDCNFGVDWAGLLPMPNGVGTYVDASTITLAGNVISHNSGDGIQVDHCANITINQGLVEDNGGDGIVVNGNMSTPMTTRAVLIKGLSIDRNQGAGVHLIDSSYNQIGVEEQGGYNLIGTDYYDDSNKGNGGDGVRIESSVAASYNTVAYNYIAGNSGNGIALVGAGVTNNYLVKNRIGLAAHFEPEDPTPMVRVVGNHIDGVAVLGGASHNLVGGVGLFEFLDKYIDPSQGDGNLIVGSWYNGVHLSDAGTTENMVQGNIIGADMSGNVASVNGVSTFNGTDGVRIDNGASNNLVGGKGQKLNKYSEGNLIAESGQAGVDLSGEGTSHNQIQGNFIGTDVHGTSALPNFYGVLIEAGASDNTVGGVAMNRLKKSSLGNLISGNTSVGIDITGTGTTGNLLQANEIGTRLDGNAALGNGSDGVDIRGGASNNTVGGIVAAIASSLLPGNLISGNGGNGVGIEGQGTSNNHVQGNKIGTARSAPKAVPNAADGVLIYLSAAGNFIGGDTPGAGNVISGNQNTGVVIALLAHDNVVQNNLIGTSPTGFGAEGNLKDGVDLLSHSNTVADNVISTNTATGLVVQGSQNTIQGNKIGTNISGAGPLPNQHDGVLIDITIGPGGNTVGGTDAGAGNLISGNDWNGIEITGPASANNHIEGNRIGTDATGKSAMHNLQDGILVKNTSGYTIGGETPTAGNLISGNHGDGVEISGGNSTGIVLLGNRIGTDVSGTAFVPNLGNGVHIDKGASNNIIGGTNAGDGNLISGNVLDGILIEYYRSEGNQLLGNRIGTDAMGHFALQNGHNGVDLVQAGLNFVGGDAAGAGNLISGNILDGVRFTGADGNVVAGNQIGTDVTGTEAVPNGGHGVDLLRGASKNTIGGVTNNSVATPGNVISGNQGSGVFLTDAGTDQNLVEGNDIGTTPYAAAALPNKGDAGVTIVNGASNNQVGGSGGVGLGSPGNVIAGNAGDGVRILGPGTQGNLVRGNVIGTNPAGQTTLSNAGHGVYLAQGAQNNSIGGADPADGNVIASNGKAGVAVGASSLDASTLGNPILSNSIYGNGGLGIDLGDDGVTPNTPGGPHMGPNSLQNTPVIDSTLTDGSSTFVVLSLNSIPNATFTIQIFANPTPDPTGYGQGKTLVATVTVTTDLLGNIASVIGPNAKVVNSHLVVAVPQNLAGQYLTATATDSSGDTSEFGRDVQVVGRTTA
jgi:parallel beta-helix repeat protein